MKLPTSNAQRPTLNVQSARFGRSRLSVRRWTFSASRRAFTLIELILVMVLITIVMSVALPSLKGFFKGRDLDSEARRLLSLTRYAASRAVAEGVPMELFVDIEQKRYGLRAQAGFLETDNKTVQYQLPEDLSFEVTAPPSKTATGEDNLGDVNTDPATITTTNPIRIARFYPDGFIGDKSPAAIILRQRAVNDSVEGEAVAIAQSATRLNYEIRTLQPSR